MGRDSPAQPGEPSPARQSRVLGHSHAQHSHYTCDGRPEQENPQQAREPLGAGGVCSRGQNSAVPRGEQDMHLGNIRHFSSAG